MNFTLRPVAPDDEAFLYRVYASTRADEMAIVPWTDIQKEAFVRMQFRAQSAFYAEHFGGADFLVIERDGAPIGRLSLDRRDDDIRIIDIALLPETRGMGLGTSLLREILAEGERTGKPVSIHVEHFNPALRLYRRLGFEVVADEGVYYLMRWSPGRGSEDQPKTA
jgi:ribosomal protein S18 acetylase RimI-like enzyme